jgi:ribonuclease P protein component
MASAERLTFPKSRHLRTASQFAAVYAARAARRVGALRVHAIPNELGHHRLGLSVGRRVGTAVRRNRVKRLLREAFRLDQHRLPGAYDLIVVVMPHERADFNLESCRRWLNTAIERLHRLHTSAASDSDGNE